MFPKIICEQINAKNLFQYSQKKIATEEQNPTNINITSEECKMKIVETSVQKVS